VYALVIPHGKRMRHTILSSVNYLSLQFFSTLSHKRHEFRREVIKQEYMIFIFSKTFSDKSHILGNIERNAVINMQMCSCKLFIILTDFIESWNFSTDFGKQSNIDFSKTPSTWSRGVKCGQMDGHRETPKLIVAIHNFATVPIIW